MNATHDWELAAGKLRQNTDARTVLAAFGLQKLLEEGEPSKVAASAFSTMQQANVINHEQASTISATYGQSLRAMLNSSKPWESLTVPEQIRQGAEPDPTIFSITLADSIDVPLQTLQDALLAVETIYGAISRVSTQSYKIWSL